MGRKKRMFAKRKDRCMGGG
jgi:hypothetical protein